MRVSRAICWIVPPHRGTQARLTGFEWLSRDPAEVQKYVSDPLCGFAFTNELTRDIFVGFVQMRSPALEARIPKTLPVPAMTADVLGWVGKTV